MVLSTPGLQAVGPLLTMEKAKDIATRHVTRTGFRDFDLDLKEELYTITQGHIGALASITIVIVNKCLVGKPESQRIIC